MGVSGLRPPKAPEAAVVARYCTRNDPLKWHLQVVFQTNASSSCALIPYTSLRHEVRRKSRWNLCSRYSDADLEVNVIVH